MPNLTLGAVVPSLIRTYVPIAVGALLSLLVTLEVIPTPLPEDQEASLVTAIVAITIGAYYTLVRLLEQKWPALGAFLGSTNQPVVYGKPGAKHRDEDGDGQADTVHYPGQVIAPDDGPDIGQYGRGGYSSGQ